MSIAFVGAGGKTSAIFRTAREIIAGIGDAPQSKAVCVTTTTHLGEWQARLVDRQFLIQSDAELKAFELNIPDGISLVVGNQTGDKLTGLTGGLLEELHQFAAEHEIPLLIEADGSHMHPLKAPDAHEPVIPAFSMRVIVVAGLQALDKPLDKNWVHRPDLFGELAGLNHGDAITSKAIAKVLLHRNGGLKDIPANTRRTVILNQADTPTLQEQARMIAQDLLAGYESLVISSLEPPGAVNDSNADNHKIDSLEAKATVENIAGIVLAAGGSSRFGAPKQLLRWRGEPFVRRVCKAALGAGLSPVVVVLGSAGDEIDPTINDLPLRIVINANWMEGLSSSIRMGIEAIDQYVGGAVFLPADQPQVPELLISSLVKKHQNTLSPIIAPKIGKRNGNPVLFDASVFEPLKSLTGDIGGRALFDRYPVQWLEWDDQNALMDIDSPEDYERYLQLFPEGEVKS